MTALLWFRHDLRLTDNPALSALARDYNSFIPVYIWDDTTPTPMGGAQKWWLHHSLAALDQALQEKYNTPLLLLKGDPQKQLENLVEQTKAQGLFWNRCYDPHAIQRDTNIKDHFKNRLSVQSFNGSLLFEPWEILNQSKKPFRVFTPFYKACLNTLKPSQPTDAPTALKGFHPQPQGHHLKDWDLLPTQPNWAQGFEPVWTPGEKGAHAQLKKFLDHGLHDYDKGRDFPAQESVSRLSPHLHFGELSPHQAWYAAQDSDASPKNISKFQSELCWREFSYYLLFHFPTLPRENFNPTFNQFEWQANKAHLKAWQRGKTGYPLVDAGMRELWTTGWMHNRVRMVVASFLTKHLLIHWHGGADWFWDTLVDADLANNSMGWQWVAGSGPDAAPYFRIFNPILQSLKFDPKGEYLRKWVPELKNLSDKDIHAPWEASTAALKQAGVTLGHTYPRPIVDHDTARKKALSLYQHLKN